MSIDICYFLSVGFAAWTVLQTGLVSALTQQGLSVAAICLGSNDHPLYRRVLNSPRVVCTPSWLDGPTTPITIKMDGFVRNDRTLVGGS